MTRKNSLCSSFDPVVVWVQMNSWLIGGGGIASRNRGLSWKSFWTGVDGYLGSGPKNG